MSRHTYEKINQINGMFTMLEQQIIHSKDMAHFRSELFYVNHAHRENYEALLLYYSDSETNPVINGACYIVALLKYLMRLMYLTHLYLFHGSIMKKA